MWRAAQLDQAGCLQLAYAPVLAVAQREQVIILDVQRRAGELVDGFRKQVR